MNLDTTNKIPYTIRDIKELKDRLDLHFEPTHAAYIYELNSKDYCIIKFHIPQTSSGTCVNNECLEKLLKDGIIERKYDNNPEISHKDKKDVTT